MGNSLDTSFQQNVKITLEWCGSRPHGVSASPNFIRRGPAPKREERITMIVMCQCCGKEPATTVTYRKRNHDSKGVTKYQVCATCKGRTYPSFKKTMLGSIVPVQCNKKLHRYLIITSPAGVFKVTEDGTINDNPDHKFYGVSKQPEDGVISFTLKMLFVNPKRALNGILWTKQDGEVKRWIKPAHGISGIARISSASTIRSTEK